jgi:hypothetical protein
MQSVPITTNVVSSNPTQAILVTLFNDLCIYCDWKCCPLCPSPSAHHWVLYSKYSISFRFMGLNATFNNISVISWRSVLLVECPKKTTDLSQVTDKLYHISHNVTSIAWVGFELTTLVVIGTDCIAYYHTITTTTAPNIQ